MSWNEFHEQYLMKLLPLNIVLQEFSEKQLDSGEKQVFYCGSVMRIFPKLDKERPQKYEVTVQHLGDA